MAGNDSRLLEETESPLARAANAGPRPDTMPGDVIGGEPSAGEVGTALCGQRRFAEAIPALQIAVRQNPVSKPLLQSLDDARHNHLHASASPRVLLVRHPTNRMTFYKVWWDWVGLNFPECLPHFEPHLLPCTVGSASDVAACVFWLQDPVEDWSMEAYRDADRLADECRQHGISLVNPVHRLGHATKLEGARRIAQAGLRTPQIVRIADADAFKRDAGGLAFPLCVREDRGHQKPIVRADTRQDLEGLSLDQMEFPIASEIVDVRGADGLYRKYRYVAAGDYGVAHHLQITPYWVTRGEDRIATDATMAEEMAYISGTDPHHELFQAARRALELDFVAFDYGYDRDGQVVVWEANPYPYIRFCSPTGSGAYRHAPMHRTLAAMLSLYLDRAGIPVPPVLETIVAADRPESARLVARLRPPVPPVTLA